MKQYALFFLYLVYSICHAILALPSQGESFSWQNLTVVQSPCVAIEPCARSAKKTDWKQYMEESSLDKWEEATHPIVFFVIGFTEIEIRGFQVLQVSSPRLGWSQGVSLCRRSVGLVGLSDWKKFEFRGDVGLVLFSIGNRKIRFGLGISKNEEVLSCDFFPSFSSRHGFLLISWLHGFQVLQVSSPDPPAQLGWSQGVSL